QTAWRLLLPHAVGPRAVGPRALGPRAYGNQSREWYDLTLREDQGDFAEKKEISRDLSPPNSCTNARTSDIFCSGAQVIPSSPSADYGEAVQTHGPRLGWRFFLVRQNGRPAERSVSCCALSPLPVSLPLASFALPMARETHRALARRPPENLS